MKKTVPYLLLVPQTILAVLFLIGLITGIIQSLGVIPAFGLEEPTLSYYKEVLQRSDMLESVAFSIKTAFISAAFATLMGVFLGGLCVMRKRAEGGFMRVVQLPIIVPHVVAALFMVNIFSRNGILARVCYMLGND